MTRLFEQQRELLQAMALRYQQPQAPKVVAKGEGSMAEAMVELARDAGVHLHPDPQLYRQLAHLEVGDEIPSEVYRAIAEIIAYVYWLNGRMP
jgi:flagellar biosynthesis protein